MTNWLKTIIFMALGAVIYFAVSLYIDRERMKSAPPVDLPVVRKAEKILEGKK